MKKFWIGLILISFLALPLIGLTQEKPSRLEICRLKHDVKVIQPPGEVTFKKDVIVSVGKIDAPGIKFEETTTISKWPCECYFKEGDLVVGRNDSCHPENPNCAGCENLDSDTPDLKGCYIKETALMCSMDVVYTIGDWIFIVVLVLALIFFLLGAVGFLTSGGNPEAIGKAQSKIIWGAVGVAVAFLARGIIKVIAGLIT